VLQRRNWFDLLNLRPKEICLQGFWSWSSTTGLIVRRVGVLDSARGLTIRTSEKIVERKISNRCLAETLGSVVARIDDLTIEMRRG
jgi:hypothetical protein